MKLLKYLKVILSISQQVSSAGSIPTETQMTSLLAHYEAGRFGDAEQLALSMTGQFPGHPFGWKVLGAVLGQLGKTDEALHANQQALKLTPQDAEAHNNLSVTLRALGRLDEAEASLRQAIDLKRDFVEAYYNLGNILFAEGDSEGAVINYKKALSIKFFIDLFLFLYLPIHQYLYY